MSHAQIMSELGRLKPNERFEVFERLCELQEQDLLNGTDVPDWEKKLLDEALEEFRLDANRGEPWRDVLQRVRTAQTK